MPRLNFSTPILNRLFIVGAIFISTTLLGAPANAPVTISEDDYYYTLDNGIVTAQVEKRSGDLQSLKYRGLEMLDNVDQREAGYWEHNIGRSTQTVVRVTIDPKQNGGERGEVSLKGISNGNPLGTGPGGSVVADVEIRYTLGRGDSGVYTYSIFSHPTNYPATSVGESRYCMKLNDDLFDWMTVDANRNMKMISTYDWNHGTQMNMKEARLMNSGIYQGTVEHKYDYSANQFDVRAWGWSSTTNRVGVWMVNPSVEYLSGGPTKFELSAHRDATFNTNALNAPAPPTLLNYWRGSHYGGSLCNIAATDNWTKVIGPFLIYCNADGGGSATGVHDALWEDALAQAVKEEKKWPYDWVNGVDYPHKNERATVTGKIVLNDPQMPGTKMSNLLVGLSAPDYTPATIPFNFRGGGFGRGGGRGGFGGGGGGGLGGFGLAGGGEDEAAATNQNNFGGRTNSNSDRTLAGGATTFTNNFGTNFFGRFGTNGFRGRFGFGLPRVVDWQNDAKNYEFWVRADARGNFTIPNVRPGNYTLHAIADGVLGQLDVTNITVASGQKLSLGKITWQPMRYGRQLWDIGIPNRNASEFFKGDDYFHWGWYLKYPKLFPVDVNYTIGKSDYRKDWFIEQVPYNTDTNNTTGTGFGDGTTWAVIFKLTNAPQGRATLRLAICGAGTRTLDAAMNSRSIGSVTNLIYNATINRDGIGGSWRECDLAFDASLMRAGTNTLELTVQPGGLTSGIMYDYLRLELDDKALVAK